MSENLKKDAFDRLVAGLSSEDRAEMLYSINKNLSPSVDLVEDTTVDSSIKITLRTKYAQESFFYRLILWFRSLFQKKNAESIYNDDIISALARRVNKNHSGLINHKNRILDSLFYERLKELKESADFFKPYFNTIMDSPGEFYVFLSSFIIPELVDEINTTADPFSLGFDVEPTIEVKKNLMRRLDDLLENMGRTKKSVLYEALNSINWLKEFSELPFVHFISQFTNITRNYYTCPYKNALIDYDKFAAVFTNVQSVSNELLETIFLFSQRKSLSKNVSNKDMENAVKEFLRIANQNLSCIQIFISSVPIIKIGKIINDNFDWIPENMTGIENWYPVFQSQWHKIIEMRWSDWVRERKKNVLSMSLLSDFNLNEFPYCSERPWASLWSRIPFTYELTAGFLSWFVNEKFDEYDSILTDVITEGVFERSQNKTEYSEGFNLFMDANKKMIDLLEKISSKGEIGSLFNEIKNQHIHSFQIQNKIDSMISTIEKEIKSITTDFIKGGRLIEAVFRGFFESNPDGIHFSLQNINTIKGHQNIAWKDKLKQTSKGLNRAIYYLLELESIDEAATNE